MSKAQSWENCDDDIKQFVLSCVDIIKLNLSDSLVGVYLHGSLAMGSYYRPKSDIDLIVVAQSNLSITLVKETNQAIARLSETRPTTGGLELSIITAEVAKKLPNPIPYALHYSPAWHKHIINDKVDYSGVKTDTDLNSHVMYIVKRGKTLYGKSINEVFGKPDWQTFIDAAMDDFNWIVKDENILETPFYGVLNICRVFQLHQENTQEPHSKDEGGEWALSNLPKEFRPIIQKALEVYRSSAAVGEEQRRRGGVEWDKERLLAFRDFAKTQIN